MNKKDIYTGIGITIILLLIFTIPKYFTGNVTASENAISSDVEKIEIYHFHGTNQCYSCITMGDYAEGTTAEGVDAGDSSNSAEDSEI